VPNFFMRLTPSWSLSFYINLFDFGVVLEIHEVSSTETYLKLCKFTMKKLSNKHILN